VASKKIINVNAYIMKTLTFTSVLLD